MTTLTKIPRDHLFIIEVRPWDSRRPHEGTYTLYVHPRAHNGGKWAMKYIEDENEPGLLFPASQDGYLADMYPVARITP